MRFQRFLRDDSGSEIAEFAIILATFSLIAMVGFAAISSASTSSVAQTQTNMTNSAVNPP